MKPVTVSARSKTLNSLLKKARRRSVILESVDGARYVLAPLGEWEAFDVGDSEDFATEVKQTAQNKKLIKLMKERREHDKDKPLVSIETVRKELGL
jgi:hypothetical protein